MENNFKIDESLLLDGSEKVGDTIWTIDNGYEKIISKRTYLGNNNRIK